MVRTAHRSRARSRAPYRAQVPHAGCLDGSPCLYPQAAGAIPKDGTLRGDHRRLAPVRCQGAPQAAPYRCPHPGASQGGIWGRPSRLHCPAFRGPPPGGSGSGCPPPRGLPAPGLRTGRDGPSGLGHGQRGDRWPPPNCLDVLHAPRLLASVLRPPLPTRSHGGLSRWARARLHVLLGCRQDGALR